MHTVDVIIPTYKPDISVLRLIDDLERQSLAPSHIIIMNTEEKYWTKLIQESKEDPLEKYDNIILKEGTNIGFIKSFFQLFSLFH